MASIINNIAPRTFLIFYVSSFLFVQNNAYDTIANLTKKLSCSIFHGEIENTFSWSSQQRHNIDLVLFESNPGTFINCFFQNSETITLEDISILLNTTGPRNLRLNSSKISNSFVMSNNSHQLVMNFQKYYLQMKANTAVKYDIIFVHLNSSQILLQGTLTRLGKLPSFSFNIFKRKSLVDTAISGNWTFLKPPCHHDVVMILPKDINVVDQGMLNFHCSYKSSSFIIR